jgi:periplasmic divalent cation tolerance protein
MLSGGWLIVFITTSSIDEAERIGRGILEKRLAACVNIVRDIKSIYWWKEKIEEGSEVLLIVKTRSEKFRELVEYVKNVHSYEVPEIIALPIIMGYSEYLKWLDETVNV